MSVRQVTFSATPLDRRISAVSVGLAILCTIIFGIIAYIAVQHGYISGLISRLWELDNEEIHNSGGQWLIVLLVLLFKAIPGTGPELLVVVTVATATYMLSALGGILTRRGWHPFQTFIFVTALAAHPLMLYAATTGQAFLLVAVAFACVILTADRLESIGDVQSQMAIGLALAFLIVTNSNGIYFIIPFLILMPIFYRQMHNVQSILAGYIMVGLPSLIALVVSFYVQIVFSHETLWLVVARWLAPLHRPNVDTHQYVWLASYGGDLGGAFGALLASILLFLPIYVVPAIRLITSVRERKRPGTAIAALLVPVLGGAFATYFWHAGSAWSFLAAALAGNTLWIATSKIKSWSRSIIIIGLFLGVSLSWALPEVWLDKEKLAWRTTIVAQAFQGVDSIVEKVSDILHAF